MRVKTPTGKELKRGSFDYYRVSQTAATLVFAIASLLMSFNCLVAIALIYGSYRLFFARSDTRGDYIQQTEEQPQVSIDYDQWLVKN